MAAGEPINSQANTKEFDEGYDRTFGQPKEGSKGGRWIWDEAQGKLVRADEYVSPQEAKDAPVLAGRFYENLQAPDGKAINNRRDHQAYMKRSGTTVLSDYTETLPKNMEKRAKALTGDFDHKQRRDDIGRAWYNLEKRRK
jgi:hypothetical protein